MSPPSPPSTAAEDVSLPQQSNKKTEKARSLPNLDNSPPHLSPLPSQGRSAVEPWSPASTARSATPLDAEKKTVPDPRVAAAAHETTHVDEPGATPSSGLNPEVEMAPTLSAGDDTAPNPSKTSRAVGSTQRRTTQLARVSRNLVHLVGRRRKHHAAIKVAPRKKSAVLHAAASRVEQVRNDGNNKPPGGTPTGEDFVIRHRIPSFCENDDAFVDSVARIPAVDAASSTAPAKAEVVAATGKEAGVAPFNTVLKIDEAGTVDTLDGRAMDHGLVLPCAPSDNEKVCACMHRTSGKQSNACMTKQFF